VTPYGNRIQNGQVVREFTLPTYRAAVETFRGLYAEGILDQEFTNNPSPQFHAKRRERNPAMYTNGIDQILPITDYFLTNPQEFGSYYVYIPRLREYPIPSSELKYLDSSKAFPIISHRVAIAESSKQKDAAWRVLEGFASPELREAQAWGREGKEYNVVNGQRVPTDRLYMNDPNDADSHYWTLRLGIIWGFWPTDVKYAIQEQRVGKDIWTRVHDSADWLRSGAEERGISPFNFTGPLPDVDAKEGEAIAFISQAIAKAITGEIDTVGFDGEVSEFKRRYGFMDEARTKALMARKDELLSYGAYEIGW
jgi:putative aldouronate transport system substrate-binding protein